MMSNLLRPGLFLLLALASVVVVAGCSGGDDENTKVLYVGGIPDQDLSLLEARFENLADYLSEELGLTVEYLPSIDYAAVVTGFKQGDIHLGWYGGLTGVQARLQVPGAVAIAQRPRDAEFHSVFVSNPSLGLKELADVAGHSLTFGSESSTSGHLMPRSFLKDAGVDVGQDLDGPPSYSGSHDTTWKLVESGAFEVGALNEAVWDARVASGDVDVSKVDVFYRTPPYFDYHWVARGDLDEEFGEGTLERLTQALLGIDASKGPVEADIAEAFQTDGFIATSNENYQAIEDVAVDLGIIER
ncbi:MAG: putative selenate ABC transporter substrate-binding protein [Chloroflexi bacterium]|nr:putative selenate ABC transporter substrate-binding protein [Chloroflexota bacterium]